MVRTFAGHDYGRIAAILGTAVGLAVAVVVALHSETADFLGEGPARVFPFDGTARRLTMGIGAGVATLVLAWGTHMLYRRSTAGAIAFVVGMGAGLFLLHAIFFPAAGLFVLAAVLDRLDGVPTEWIAAWSPRARLRLWAISGIVAVPVVVGIGMLSVYLLGPLFDEGEEMHEALAFEVAAPGQASGTMAPAEVSPIAMPASASMAPVARLIAEGQLKGEDSFHFGEGQVRIIKTPEGGYIVRFDNYSVRNGPDLFVYVSPDPGGDVHAQGAANISPVKATRGDLSYDLPAEIDPSSIRSVVIYCRQFRVKFATAVLTPP